MSKVVWYECRYCDSPGGPADYEGDKVCSGCGAEWNPIRCEQDAAEFEREMRELDLDQVLQAIRESIISRSQTLDKFGEHIDHGFEITKCEKYYVWSSAITYRVEGRSDTATFVMIGVDLTSKNEPIPGQMLFGFVSKLKGEIECENLSFEHGR